MLLPRQEVLNFLFKNLLGVKLLLLSWEIISSEVLSS